MLSLRERTEARLDLGGMLNRLGVRDWNCFGSDRRKADLRVPRRECPLSAHNGLTVHIGPKCAAAIVSA